MSTAPAAHDLPAPRRPRSLPAAVVAQLRPRQWIKNIVVLGGLVFSGRLREGEADFQALLGFVVFCLASSAVYVLNDLLDLSRDRLNPRTAGRPLASGDLPLAWAPVLAAVCLAGAVAISIAADLPPACPAILAVYAVQNVVYSLFLKREAVADVMSIALGFVLRLLFGILAVGAVPTAWAILCMFFLALFLGFAKRRGELGAADPLEASSVRPVLAQYNVAFLNILMAMAAAMTVMCYAVFTVIGRRNPTLVITIVPVTYCVFRYLLQVTVLGRGQSPEDILLSDRRIWAGVAAWAGLVVWILYWDVHLFAEG